MMTRLSWLAMAVIHCSSLPSLIDNLVNEGANLPPLSLIAMVWSGLLILFIRAWIIKDTLYICGNGVGLIINTLGLVTILSA